MLIKVNKYTRNIKTLRFGFDDETYNDLFGSNIEFMGSFLLIKEDLYGFNIDKVDRSKGSSISSSTLLRLSDPRDKELIYRALKYDYGFSDADFKFIDYDFKEA